MFDTLLSPLRVGHLRLRNRVVQLATANRLEDGGRIGERTVAFYEARARGGVAAIVTGALSVHASGDHAFLPAHDRRALPGFETLAEAVHRHGAVLIGQLNHVGRQHHQDGVPALIAPSPIPCPRSGGTPHALTSGEIDELVDSFVASARNLAAAGFDGVEIHAGQGYLLQQFLSPYSNRRDDEYGATTQNRARLTVRVLDAVRQACGDRFAVGLRLGVDEFVTGGLTLDLSCEVAAHLAASTEIDYLSVTQGNFVSIENHTPDRRYDRAHFSGYAEAVRKAVQTVAGPLPVVTCGRILEPATADDLLVAGTADLVGLCRPLIADPDWVAKAANAAAGPIRRCISCNQCWGWITTRRPIGCVVNVATGREEAAAVTAAPVVRDVLVVGGGPAGLQAALTAALRGHRVTVLDRNTTPGGALLGAATVAGYEEVAWVAQDLAAEARRAGVSFELGVEVTPSTLAGRSADVVVIATGATQRVDDVRALTTVPVHGYQDVLAGRVEPGRRVVVLDDDGYYAATAVAEKVAALADHVTLVTPFFEVGREIPATCRITTLAALDELGVDTVTGAWLAEQQPQRPRSVAVRRLGSRRTVELDDVDSIVRVGNPLPADELYAVADGLFGEVHRIGDAYQPRRLHDALLAGEQAARAI